MFPLELTSRSLRQLSQLNQSFPTQLLHAAHVSRGKTGRGKKKREEET